jgi:hypothetical protein
MSVAPETKRLRAALKRIGVKPVQVRTDRVLHGTTATVFCEEDIAALTAHAHGLGAAGYAVIVHLDENHAPFTALVTTDPRRTAGIGGAA